MLMDIDIILRVFFNKRTYLMYINRERTTKGAHARLMKLTPFFLFVLVKRDKDEI